MLLIPSLQHCWEMRELQQMPLPLNTCSIHVTFQWSQQCTPFLLVTSPATVASTTSNETPLPTKPPQSSTSPSTLVKSELQSTESEKEVNNSKLLQPS